MAASTTAPGQATRRHCVVFDDRRGMTSPLTDLRPSFLVRTGPFSMLERLRHDKHLVVEATLVPQEWVVLVRELTNLPAGCSLASEAPVLLINGRCPLVPESAHQLPPGTALCEHETGDIIAACVPCSQARQIIDAPAALTVQRTMLEGRWLISRPWHVRSFRDQCLAHDIQILTPYLHRHDPSAGKTIIGRVVDIRLHEKVRLHNGVILDSEGGPVMVDEDAVIRPGAVLIGPCYVGPHCTILERATIRPGTAIGPWCKINGEVWGTIFQGYSNKAHDGFLGDSWVGEWVNLGAGTTNSNLLNTYDEVIARASPDARHERTGEQFMGAIIGDHVKTAICTRIMTGAVLGTGGMFACTQAVSGATHAFSWVTDRGAQPYRHDKFLDAARAMMQRRTLIPSEAYLARLRDVHTRLAPPTGAAP